MDFKSQSSKALAKDENHQTINIFNVDHLPTTHQWVDPAYCSYFQQSLIEKVDW